MKGQVPALLVVSMDTRRKAGLQRKILQQPAIRDEAVEGQVGEQLRVSPSPCHPKIESEV